MDIPNRYTYTLNDGKRNTKKIAGVEQWYNRQTSNVTRILVGNKASRRCSNYIFILELILGLNGLGKDNCKTKGETFKFLEFGPSYTRWFDGSEFKQKFIAQTHGDTTEHSIKFHYESFTIMHEPLNNRSIIRYR